jgi:large subunit ribosomal protein L10
MAITTAVVHQKKWKHSEAKILEDLARKSRVVAIAAIEGLPSSALQNVRKSLRGKAIIKVTKTKVAKKAFEKIKDKQNFEKILEQMKGSIAIVFTEMNPFELQAIINKSKTRVAAKAGQIAPEDLEVPAKDTGFPPGPALSDLKSAGLETKIEGGTIHIVKPKIVAKKGEEISDKVANVLGKLNIKPISVGLIIKAAYEQGIIYKKDVLEIDYAKLFEDYVFTAREALNLALNMHYPTKQTMPLFISKAYNEAVNLALMGNYVSKETIELILAKAQAQGLVLKNMIKE